MTCYFTFEALDSFPLCARDEVANKVGAVQFVCCVEVAFAPQLGFGTENERFVCRQSRIRSSSATGEVCSDESEHNYGKSLHEALVSTVAKR